MTRRQSLTVLLLLLAILVAFRGKARWLLPIGFAFTWLFDGFPLLLGVCGAALGGGSGAADWGLIGYPALGVLLGNIVIRTSRTTSCSRTCTWSRCSSSSA